MKYIICLLSAFGISSAVIAQQEVPEFGKIDTADLRLKSCSFEPSANSMSVYSPFSLMRSC